MMATPELTEVKNTKKKVIVFLLLLIVAMAGIFIAYFNYRQSAITAERGSLSATGTVEAKTVMASFKIAGKIGTLLVDEGSAVEKGQELAVLESRELEAKYAQARGASNAAEGQARQAEKAITYTSQTVEALIEQAQANLDDAQQKYQRAESMHASKAISDSQFDEATNNLKAAQGQLDEALAGHQKIEVARNEHSAAVGQNQQALGAVQEAQVYLDNTHLKAPMSGFITEKNLEEGEMLNAGTPVFEITDLKNTYVKVFIDEKKIGRVHLNQSAEVRVDTFPGKAFAGKVVWINQAGQFAVQKAINEQYSHDIRSYEVKINVPNEDLALKTGMTATVKILEDKLL